MLVRRGARFFDAVRVAQPADAATISAVLRGCTVQLLSGLVEVNSGTARCFARPGQWIAYCRASGEVLATDDNAFLARFEAA